MADAPLKNLEYYVSRLNGYQKNTVYVQPDMYQQRYTANDHKITFKLPQNAIIDLHTLCLSYDLGITANGGNASGTANVGVLPPRFTSCQVRRLDVMMGGMQVGLSNLPDYGAAYSLSKTNEWAAERLGENSIYENAYNAGEGMVPAVSAPVFVQPQGGTGYWRQQISSFLGILEGSFMRFLDTNLLPDVTIQITLAPSAAFYYDAGANNSSYSWSNVKLFAEVIRFGDDAYEKMVEARLSTGDPIMIPFTNWAMYETTTNIAPTGDAMSQFTVTTQSLDRLWGTFRVGDYDTQRKYSVTSIPANANVKTYLFGPDFLQTYYYRFTSCNAVKGDATSGTGLPSTINVDSAASTVGAPTADSTVGPARYQFEVDSKLYPQFLADVADCYFLTKNALDKAGNHRNGCQTAQYAPNWSGQCFALVVNFQHNTGEANMDGRLISGLNTTGSNLPIVWKATNLTVPAVADGTAGTVEWATSNVRPTVFAEMTSSLLIYPGRVISVIN